MPPYRENESAKQAHASYYVVRNISRLRNNGAIILSRGNRAFIFCLVNMSYSLAGLPKKFIEFISPVLPSLCCACETGIALKLKNSSYVHINLVQGRELGEAGEFVERALDVTLNPNTLFALFVRTVTNFYRTLSRNTQKTRKNLERNRKSDWS